MTTTFRALVLAAGLAILSPSAVIALEEGAGRARVPATAGAGARAPGAVPGMRCELQGVPAADTEENAYARREAAAPELAAFTGGHSVEIVGAGCGCVIVAVIVLLILL